MRASILNIGAKELWEVVDLALPPISHPRLVKSCQKKPLEMIATCPWN
jgi:hypothetical protein